MHSSSISCSGAGVVLVVWFCGVVFVWSLLSVVVFWCRFSASPSLLSASPPFRLSVLVSLRSVLVCSSCCLSLFVAVHSPLWFCWGWMASWVLFSWRLSCVVWCVCGSKCRCAAVFRSVLRLSSPVFAVLACLCGSSGGLLERFALFGTVDITAFRTLCGPRSP